MTVATAIAGLLPIFWSTRPGVEVMQPRAAPVVGGMLPLSSTSSSPPRSSSPGSATASFVAPRDWVDLTKTSPPPEPRVVRLYPGVAKSRQRPLGSVNCPLSPIGRMDVRGFVAHFRLRLNWRFRHRITSLGSVGSAAESFDLEPPKNSGTALSRTNRALLIGSRISWGRIGDGFNRVRVFHCEARPGISRPISG